MRIFTNEDCMEVMKRYPDKFFDLAIVDPPYGIGRFGNRIETSYRICKQNKINKWDIKPNDEYFKELFRLSTFQIIFGANNFTLPNTEYFIVWDKHQTVDNFASAEYAWTNIKMPAKVFRYSVHQMMNDQKKEHPTQKPIALYKWLCKNYAKPGMKILDTHVGSASSLIAFEEFGLDYVGYELDPDYYKAACERLEKHREQLKLFEPGFES